MPMIRVEKLTKSSLQKFRKELAEAIEKHYPSDEPGVRFSSGEYITNASEDYIVLQAIERARQSLRMKTT